MIKNIYYMMKYKKGELTWTQIVMAVIAVIIIAVFFFISLKAKGDIKIIDNEVGGYFD